MRLPWRRSRTLHQQLMEEAQLDDERSARPDNDAGGWAEEPAAGWGFGAGEAVSTDALGQPAPAPGAAFHGIPRQRGEWDAVITAEAPGLEGEELDFLALEDGDVFMEHALPRGDVSPLADAVEARLAPPYRAHAVRQQGDLWAVSARRIRLERFQARGNEIDLTVRQGERALRIDGRDVMAEVPGLEALGQTAGADYHVWASRVEGDLWEVEVSPL
jgi:hypothetical protein